jgi:outer membrane murein-binding lipoprotein Lpp
MAMRDRRDTMEPYEPSEDAYDWDYDGEPGEHQAPTILWGRVAVLGAAILLAFLVGRLTAGGVPEEDLNRVRSERDDARAQVADLQAEVDTLQAELETAQNPTETPPADEEQDPAAGEEDPTAGEESTTYTVQSGDTLQGIAEEVYCDPRAFEPIAAANPTDVGPAPNYIVQPGAELIIPDDPQANAC